MSPSCTSPSYLVTVKLKTIGLLSLDDLSRSVIMPKNNILVDFLKLKT